MIQSFLIVDDRTSLEKLPQAFAAMRKVHKFGIAEGHLDLPPAPPLDPSLAVQWTNMLHPASFFPVATFGHAD
jgi:hypothetical protein